MSAQAARKASPMPGYSRSQTKSFPNRSRASTLPSLMAYDIAQYFNEIYFFSEISEFEFINISIVFWFAYY